MNIAFFLLFFLLRSCKAQLSAALPDDDHFSFDGNKYLQRRADLDDVVTDGEEIVINTCPLNIELKWMTEVSSSVYATPLITDLFSDGRKDIVVSSFVHYLEVLEGQDGAQAMGWPAYHKSTVHASPALYDIDLDGVPDIMLPSYNGDILFFKDTGEQLFEQININRLKVKKDWYKNVNGDVIDHSHPDVGDGEDDGVKGLLKDSEQATSGRRLMGLEDDSVGSGDESYASLYSNRRRIHASDDSSGNTGDTHGSGDESGGSSIGVEEEKPGLRLSAEAADSFDVFQDYKSRMERIQRETASHWDAGDADADEVGDKHWAHESDTGGVYDEFGNKLDMRSDDEQNEHAHHFHDYAFLDALNAQQHDTVDEDHDRNAYHHLFSGDYMDHHHQFDHENFWGDDAFMQGEHYEGDQEYVHVDPHILCNPAVGDLDGDGHEELVVAVSYFFDKDYYDSPDHIGELPADVDRSKYVASGIAVFDLRTRMEKWVVHLDLSTDSTQFKAHAYSSPTLADLDGDGRLEIVVGTSMGFLYVLDAEGNCLEGWPKQMGEIQGQPLVEDLNNDGKLEILATDTRGSIAVFTPAGEEVWERHMRSLMSQGAVAGDINGDGELEIVVGSASGSVFALRGSNGEDVKGFPFKTRGRVHAPALITRLADGPAQHIVLMSFDGFLYLIDGVSGCADTVDIGETTYSMVLADDIDSNGRMDLIVCTMNGNVYAFETPSEYHPLKTWTSQSPGPSSLTARHDWFGVYATERSRAPRDVAGDTVPITVNIVDRRSVYGPNGTLSGSHGGPYNLSIVLKGVGVAEMRAGPQPIIGVADTVPGPGTYTMELMSPRTRTTATVHIELIDQYMRVYTDEFSLSFHMHFHRLLKWLIALPMVTMVAVLLALGKKESEDHGLPSFHTM